MTNKHIAIIIVITLLLISIINCSEIISATEYRGKVIKVADGDSITILHEGKELRIRLAEIDAPERGQPFWRKSREALANYVAGKDVEVVEVDIDRYDRVVGQVYLGELWVNSALVRDGYAYVFPEYATSSRLYAFEREAQKNKNGIWKLPAKERMKPWEWRKR